MTNIPGRPPLTFTATGAQGRCPHCHQPVPRLPCPQHPRYGWLQNYSEKTNGKGERTEVLFVCEAAE